MSSFFITATDTDAGKTLIATALTASLVASNKSVAVFKPVSAGCDLVDDTLVNQDAKLLQGQANCQQSITNINPIAFAEPIAPHIAALNDNTEITTELICEHFNEVMQIKSDVIITEGAGGWRLPLGNGEFLSDFVRQQQLDVILVVGMKLGCLNHAILTYESIINDGVNIVGWVANHPVHMPYLEENIELLKSTFKAPLLGRLGFVSDLEQAINSIDIRHLIN
ncbi:dethiobiotin synthase [Thalassotalea psychrophila]|uniref:ATP-dependent dethiobiotin synthetase BioD n=1 Tax=Thalassotalea psychrophila TaxID=3065647 RepID=A0ABY9TNY4_9GAMM|nr:dethiobiotin synthase [Colwelliaceae bacterium SQ149]